MECPVLLIAGAHDPVTRPEWGIEVAEAFPPGRGEMVALESSSHMIMADEPDRFARLVEGFIEA